MSKPFLSNDDFIVIIKDKWYRFPTSSEAWEFYFDQLDAKNLDQLK